MTAGQPRRNAEKSPAPNPDQRSALFALLCGSGNDDGSVKTCGISGRWRWSGDLSPRLNRSVFIAQATHTATQIAKFSGEFWGQFPLQDKVPKFYPACSKDCIRR